jgi:hypothetical protein
MVDKKMVESGMRTHSGRGRARRVTRTSDARMARPTRAQSANLEAWSAVSEVFKSSKTQPANAARVTGKGLRNVARTGAKQTGIAANSVAHAAEAVLMSAMSEATTAAKAARSAAREVEIAVRRALRAIRLALRQRGYAAVNQATGARRRNTGKSAASKRRRARAT